jgi:hypothetical protein
MSDSERDRLQQQAYQEAQRELDRLREEIQRREEAVARLEAENERRAAEDRRRQERDRELNRQRVARWHARRRGNRDQQQQGGQH